MLLDLRVLFTASLAAVLLLLGGFATIALLRPPGKLSTAIQTGSEEITGAIGKRGEKSQSLTEEDKAAQPAQRASEPVRAANLDKPDKEKSEKAPTPETADDKAAQAKNAAAAKARPRIQAAPRQELGANFKANNPFAFPFFGTTGGGQ
ncbi:MAG TPA: hypothetical protein VEH75_02250 [Xanthobacteraceae bacterium]|nr:hypothetical protein [Xanthobacteraceae bacterium]